MSDILVKPPQLRASAHSLRQHAGRIRAAVEAVDHHMRALGPARFEGRRAAEIRGRYQRQRDRLLETHKYILRYAQMLETAAGKFEKADRMLANNGGNFWTRLWERIEEIFYRLPGMPSLPRLPQFKLPNLKDLIPDLLPDLPDWFGKPDYEPLPDSLPDQPTGGGGGTAGGGGGADQPVSQDPYPGNPGGADQSYQSIDALDPAGNYRYQPNRQGKGETYCNIFAMDYAKKMGAPLPEYLDWNSDGTIDRYLDANKMTAWLRGTFNEGGGAVVQGPAQGWQSMDSGQAAEMASKGYVVIAGWENQGGIGHMAVVRPDSTADNIRIAQAGSSRFADGSLTDGFGTGKQIEFFVYLPGQGQVNL